MKRDYDYLTGFVLGLGIGTGIITALVFLTCCSSVPSEHFTDGEVQTTDSSVSANKPDKYSVCERSVKDPSIYFCPTPILPGPDQIISPELPSKTDLSEPTKLKNAGAVPAGGAK